jgi:(1->4)-alpha-D-glucan 1-alpha-D-glucosylmutase
MKIPATTYRLQFNREFGFADAEAAVAYLRELGVSDIYASPIFHARSGSMHGYDIVDPNRLNPELGSEQEFASLIDQACRHDLGWLQDIVPNHMAYDGQNHMLMDVLENGEASRFKDYFDIDWNHPYENLKAKILAPFLGEFYGDCLEKGEISLYFGQNGIGIRYHEMRFPLSIESYGDVLTHNLARLRKRCGAGDLDFIKLLGVLYALKNIAPKEESGERADQIVFIKQMLWELYCHNGEIQEFIDSNVNRFNGVPGKPETFNLLDSLLAQQWYRLSFWKVAAEELDYRRFFNINELISLRVEEEKVFRHTHALAVKLAREGRFTGLRVDHVDGLYDPLGYLQRLRREAGEIYLIVEKILGFEEELPGQWPIEGTTGYEFLNFVSGMFCARQQRRRFSQIYSRFTGLEDSCSALMSDKKRLIIGKYMAGDIEGLAYLLKSVSSRNRHAADITLYGLKRALVEVLTFFPVYRSYVSADSFSAQDRCELGTAIARAKEANAGLLLELNFIERFLLLDFAAHLSAEEKARWTHFVMRFQQLTGPLMAKGFEDTTMYVYNRLLSLNEVGGDPDRFGVGVDEFHDFIQRRKERWPHAMNTTATHDTKRGEDARARINVLSEIPDQWDECLKAWSKINHGKKIKIKGQEAPDRNDEHFLYQTLIGSYPVSETGHTEFLPRLCAYLVKAVREAKMHTEWLKPDLAYEQAFTNFVTSLLVPADSNRFLSQFAPVAKKIAHCGMYNSLGQTLLKITVPGVADFYQGTELWDLSFVDPDNRRQVDFAKRAQLLDNLKHSETEDRPELLRDLRQNWHDGRIKFYLTYKLNNFRRAYPEIMIDGDYLPLDVSGELGDRVCAFARRSGSAWAVAVTPRLIGAAVFNGAVPLGGVFWRSTAVHLPKDAPAQWVNIVTGRHTEALAVGTGKVLPLQVALKEFPVALLFSTGAMDEPVLQEERTSAASFEHF